MENFFQNDKFYPDLGDLIIDLELEDDEVEKLEDNWELEAWQGYLEPLVVLSPDWIIDRVDEERFSEDGSEPEKMANILDQIDWDKINAQIPKLWYEGPKSSKFKITKNDLLNWIK